MSDGVVLTVHLNKNVSGKDIENLIVALSMLRGVKAVGDGSRLSQLRKPAQKVIKYREECEAVLKYLNLIGKKGFETVDAHLELIEQRLREAVKVYGTLERASLLARRVVIHRCNLWKNDPKMVVYLQPSTLFGKKNFWNYAGALPDDLKVKKEGDDGSLL